MSTFRFPMNLQLFAGEKTESATPKKRQQSRKKGQVAKSMELPSAFILLFSFLSFLVFGSFYKERIYKLFTDPLHEYMLMEITAPNIMALAAKFGFQMLLMLAPIFAITVLIAVLGNYVQIGLLFTGEPLMMKLNKLNPIEGAKRIFSMRAVVDFIKSMLKVTIIGVIVYLTLWGEKEKIMGLAHLPLESIFSFVASLTVQLGLKIGATLIIIAFLDYLYQKYEFEKSIRMSKQDIKDEYKTTEGDPLVKGKIKERQRKMAMQRMMQEVPKADVVITNPTHYAVALKYEAGKMEAPLVIAKGTDFIALKIKEIAKANRIVTMENRPLARALHDQVDIGQAIPPDLFQAVAEVLAYVYKLKGRSK